MTSQVDDVHTFTSVMSFTYLLATTKKRANAVRTIWVNNDGKVMSKIISNFKRRFVHIFIQVLTNSDDWPRHNNLKFNKGAIKFRQQYITVCSTMTFEGNHVRNIAISSTFARVQCMITNYKYKITQDAYSGKLFNHTFGEYHGVHIMTFVRNHRRNYTMLKLHTQIVYTIQFDIIKNYVA